MAKRVKMESRNISIVCVQERRFAVYPLWGFFSLFFVRSLRFCLLISEFVMSLNIRNHKFSLALCVPEYVPQFERRTQREKERSSAGRISLKSVWWLFDFSPAHIFHGNNIFFRNWKMGVHIDVISVRLLCWCVCGSRAREILMFINFSELS